MFRDERHLAGDKEGNSILEKYKVRREPRFLRES